VCDLLRQYARECGVSRVGFTAACQDCPTVTGDYGERIHNGVMSWSGSVQAQIEVMNWAKSHADETGHTITVRHYISLDVEANEMDAEVWRKLTSG